jgi:AP-2 complex subunit beta-1
MSGAGQDAKFFQRGKIQVRTPASTPHFACHQRPAQELRAELQAAETKDKKFTKRKMVLKRIVANITMGNDSPSSCCP